jgi:photosystem II stability/assembly factor-like uncharacterized protein
MKKYIMFLSAMSLIILNYATALSADGSAWEEIGRGCLNLNTVLVDKDNPDIIYIGSNNTVFKSQDCGQTWKSVLSVRGQNRNVNLLVSELQDKNALYAACGNGLFYSNNQGKYWKRIFTGRNYLENDCTSIVALPPVIYLGTRAGLFISKDKGLSWHKAAGKPGSSQIAAVAGNKNMPDIVYVVSSDGVFKSRDKGESWARIFTANLLENNGNSHEALEEERETKFSNLRYILIDPNDSNILYLATSRGIFKSDDQGKTWQDFPGYGLLSQDVKFLLMSDGLELFALTKSSIYKYGNQRWQEISLGLASTDIRFIALDKRYNLYAACDKGLFKARGERDNATNADTLSLYLKGEPDIRKVQEAAIEYAEVHPDKIKSWRKQAARKAILPQLSAGVGRNVTDLWHWETGSTAKIDDDVLKRGRDAIEWDITLSWDLSELIWNNDQTSIDSRSKLMSELRDNILDEVTRVYFERIRLKIELDSLTIEDRKKKLEKELRLKELSASLDALTGGYFSRALQ